MEQLSPEDFGQRVARKRGSMGIRAAAQEIGTSPATLSRVERGHLPDVRTLVKICAWLGIDPGLVIGSSNALNAPAAEARPNLQIAFKQGQAFQAKTAKSLTSLIMASQANFVKKIDNEGH